MQHSILLSQVLEKLEMPVLVYDIGKLNIHDDPSHTEPCPVFSKGHGEDSGEGHGEDHDDTDSHNSDQEDRPFALVPKEEIFMRHTFFPAEKYQRTFFVWATNERSLSHIMDTFNSSALICPQKVDVGVFHIQTR